MPYIGDWKTSKDREVLNMGITTNEYFALQNLGLSKASVRKYMYELADKGFLQVTDHSGRANIYDLATSEVASINYDLKHIDDSIYENICYEIGEWVIDIMKEDKFIEGLSIMNFDSEVKKPTWISKKP